MVHFDGFDKLLTIYNDYPPDPGFTVSNLSPRTIVCFVSTNSRASGNSSWFPIGPGQNTTWARPGWEAVAVKSQDGKQRKGEFIDNRGGLVKVDFLGFDEDFVVHEAPEDFIAAEHYAEAIRIADRSYAAGDSKAFLPGGLTASIFKCDTLEFLTTGAQVASIVFQP